MRILPLSLVLVLTGCPPTDKQAPHDSDAEADTDTDVDADTDTDTDTNVPAPPSAPVVAITPTAPADAADMTATIVTPSVDPNGDAVSYRYAWSVDGSARADLTTEMVPASETTEGQTWAVEVTPTDGALDGTPGTATVVIGNAPPVAPTLHIEPVAPVSGDALTLTFDVPASDPDGDALTQTITWYQDESEMTGLLDQVEVSGSYVDGGETFRAVVTVSDGWNTPVTAEASVTVANEPPTMTTPRIDPTNPKDDDDLRVVVTGTDPDGGDVSYRYTWYRDGVEATDVGDTDTVPASATTVGEEWTVTVYVSDGTDEVSDSAAATTILDWEGYTYVNNFTVFLPVDSSGGYPTATGNWAYSILTQGGRGTNDCDLEYDIVGVEDARICPRCDYSFDATYTYDAAASVTTTAGRVCTDLASDMAGQFYFMNRSRPLLSAFGYSSGYSYYYYGYLSLYAYGTGGYSGGYGSYVYSSSYEVTSSEDTAGNVTIEAYSYRSFRY